jgi:hypothetical protein
LGFAIRGASEAGKATASQRRVDAEDRRGVNEEDVDDSTEETCMRTEQPTGKAAWGAVIVVALVALGCSTTMFARQADDPIDTPAVVLESRTTDQAVQIAEAGTDEPAADESEMSADGESQEAMAADTSDTDTEEASFADNATGSDTEEASAADNASNTEMEAASVDDDMPDGDTELASTAVDAPDTETEGVSPETGNP